MLNGFESLSSQPAEFTNNFWLISFRQSSDGWSWETQQADLRFGTDGLKSVRAGGCPVCAALLQHKHTAQLFQRRAQGEFLSYKEQWILQVSPLQQKGVHWDLANVRWVIQLGKAGSQGCSFKAVSQCICDPAWNSSYWWPLKFCREQTLPARELCSVARKAKFRKTPRPATYSSSPLLQLCWQGFQESSVTELCTQQH